MKYTSIYMNENKYKPRVHTSERKEPTWTFIAYLFFLVRGEGCGDYRSLYFLFLCFKAIIPFSF